MDSELYRCAAAIANRWVLKDMGIVLSTILHFPQSCAKVNYIDNDYNHRRAQTRTADFNI
jgi:hypothetical protein